jgi:hypothetical protein
MARRKLSWREATLLALLAIAGIAALSYRKLPMGFGGSEAPAAAGTLPKGDPPKVHMEELDHPTESYDPEGRNLFSYYVPPPLRRPDPPPIAHTIPPPPSPQPVQTQPVVETPVVQIPRDPPPPTPSFQYIGHLGPKDAKLAVFDVGRKIELKGIGDVVQEHYRVAGFGYETVVLTYVDEKFKGKTTELRKRSGSK